MFVRSRFDFKNSIKNFHFIWKRNLTNGSYHEQCKECEIPSDILKEIDQTDMTNSIEKYSRHLCIGQSMQYSQWPKDIRDIEGDYVREVVRLLKKRQKNIGYTKLSSASNASLNSNLNTADWYIFPDQIKLNNINMNQIEEIIEKLFITNESINMRDKTKTIEQKLLSFSNNIHFEKLNGLWLLVCCHYQRDQRCGIIGPILAEQIEKYIQQKKMNNVNFLRISHVGGHKYAGNVIVYPTGTWYGRVLPRHIPLIIDAYTSSNSQKDELKPLLRGQVDKSLMGDTNI